MAEKKYTMENLANAEELMKALSTMPKEKQSAVVMVGNAFIAGMEATKAQLAEPTPASA